MSVVRLLLFAFGYPVSILVIARFVPVVRERRLRWILWHQAAVGTIVLGFALDANWSAVAINGTWFVVAAVWYVLGGRNSRSPQPAD